MRIAHVIDYFQPTLGYQETFLALEQIKAGHIVRVFTSDRYYPFKDYVATYGKILGKRIVGSGNFNERGIEVTRLNVAFTLGSRLWLKGLGDSLNEFKPDLIICHRLTSFTSYTLSKVKFVSRPKIIYDDHMSGTLKDGLKGTLIRLFYLLFLKRSIERSADKIACAARASLEYVSKKLLFDPKKVVYLPLGVDCDFFRPSQEGRQEIRNKYGIRNNQIVGIYTGKIHESKGIRQLAAALKVLLKERKDFKFIFVGSGDEGLVSEVKASLPEGSYIFEEFVPQKELVKYFSAADFGIWPSGVTCSHLEAIACGLPIIVSSAPVSIERISNDNGIFVKNCNKEEIINAIKLLLDDAALRSRYSHNSLEFARLNSWKAINDRLLAL